MTIRFDEALPNLLKWLDAFVKTLPAGARLVVVRDLRAQFRLITDVELDRSLNDADDTSLDAALGAFRAAGDFIITLSAPSGFDAVFDTPESVRLEGFPPDVRFVDRMVTGREWLYPVPVAPDRPRRIAFFGLKGGVGRSTSISMAAWRLAQLEKRVLVIDLDLESPGLGNMLLPYRSDLTGEGDSGVPGWPSFGLVDWFVEDAVGQVDAGLLNGMIQPSPINGVGRGEVMVVPAAGGSYNQDYVSKLSRVYTDLPNAGGIEIFGDRLLRAISALEGVVQPDVTLLDSRAGIHHISATVLTRVADLSYLFASNSRQTWSGFSSLFSHWTLNRDSVRAIREKLRLVSALTPTTSNKEEWRDSFGENSFDSFARLYDEEPAEAIADTEASELFSFGVYEDGAPHRPVIVWDSPVYVNFDPLLNDVQLDEENAVRVFGELFESIEQELAGDETDEA